MELNEHGLPELTPELIQESRDVIAIAKAFGEKIGVKHLDISVMSVYSKMCIFGSCDQRDDGTDKGFWSLDIYSDGDTREKYLEYSQEADEGEEDDNNGND